ncbi:solute carrier organic anion transporter family member 1B3 isoform X2 [Microcaecilia unicolor]|uniref:Solute carrier organic anion transporter family member n=1 Tax=Microcaecilia unicolor TaxID=1415580 RepID=A0A6P7ZBQ6_9AMPH|nr:solute carrier organic anion transporter family member 1B3-like isoform X2 [Microcaecilia unicolor]
MRTEENVKNSSDSLSSSTLSCHNDNVEVQKKSSCCANPKIFVVALSLCYFAKALSGSYMKSSITQIERRFNIPTSIVGVIDGSFEMGNLLVLAFISYFGAKFHRPKTIAAGCLIMSIGSFLTAMPHLFMGLYKYETAVTHETSSNNLTSNLPPCLADLNQTTISDGTESELGTPTKDCNKEAGSYMWIYVLMGNVLRGIGETPIVPLACVQAIGIIGPILGFILGSLCAKLYVDIGFVNPDNITITPQDSRWVGAWWLGFLVSGIVSLLSAIPFCFIPKTLKKQVENENNVKETSKFKMEKSKKLKPKDSQQGNDSAVKGFFISLKRLLTNQLYVFYQLIFLLQTSSLIGVITYSVKYMEQQYGLSASRANFLIGVTGIPAVAIGIFVGGLFIKKYKLRIIGIIKFAFWTSFLGFLVSLASYLLGCQNISVAGLTTGYNGSHQIIPQENTFTSPCNIDCKCSTNHWDPVCGNNGITYMSSCLAGCKSSTGYGRNVMFQNCSCIEAKGSQSRDSTAILGACPKGESCSRMVIYFIISQALSAFIASLGGTCGFIIMFRCVDQELKSLAIGICMWLIRSLAGIPAPIYFGALIDMACLKWGSKSCGGQGACRVYDATIYRNTFFGLITGIRVPSYILHVLYIIMAKKRFQEDSKAMEDAAQEEKATNRKADFKGNEDFKYSEEEKETCI